MSRSRWLYDDTAQEWTWAPDVSPECGSSAPEVRTVERTPKLYTPDGQLIDTDQRKRRIGFGEKP